MSADPVELVLGKLQNVTKNDRGGAGDCPVSGCTYRLKVTPGDGGRALLACAGGHRAEDVLGALDLSMADLFVPNGREHGTGERYTPQTTPQQRNTPG